MTRMIRMISKAPWDILFRRDNCQVDATRHQNYRHFPDSDGQKKSSQSEHSCRQPHGEYGMVCSIDVVPAAMHFK